MSNKRIAVANKFESILRKRANLMEEVESLVSMMHNEGYVDEDILGLVEEALMRKRPSSMDSRPTMFEGGPTDVEELRPNRPTSIEPLSQLLTERASVANKFKRVLNAKRNR